MYQLLHLQHKGISNINYLYKFLHYHYYRTLLTDFEKQQIEEACNMAIDLNNFKLKIYEYVESRMAFIAPNISIIVGSSIAAKLMGVAGGLTKLAKIPACNVQLLGQQKKTISGFSQVTTTLPHTGFVFFADIVQNTPPVSLQIKLETICF